MSRRILLVTNEAAGSSGGDVLDQVTGVLDRGGTVARATLDGLDGLDLTDTDLIVAAGGDGTVHHMVAALHRRGVDLTALPIAVVPLGTGNDLSRSLGLDPNEPVDAATVALDGQPAPADLIIRTDGIVVNAAHAGLGAVAAEVASEAKSSLGDLAYPLGALIAGVRTSGWELEVRVDGELFSQGSTLLVGVGNGRTVGGGTPMFPDADLSDGLLDVLVSHSTGPVARGSFGLALRSGSHADRDDVIVTRGERVEISGDEVPHNTDGELGPETATETYEIVPAALLLVRPGR